MIVPSVRLIAPYSKYQRVTKAQRLSVRYPNSAPNIEDDRTTRYIQEALLQYALGPKLQVSGFWRGAFADKSHTFRVGLTVYFVG